MDWKQFQGNPDFVKITIHRQGLKPRTFVFKSEEQKKKIRYFKFLLYPEISGMSKSLEVLPLSHQRAFELFA